MVNLILAIFLWLVAAAIGVGNSAIADTFIAPVADQQAVEIYKTVVLILVFFILSWIYARQTRGTTWGTTALGTGFLWLGLSVLFQLVLKRYVICGQGPTAATNYLIAQEKLSQCLMSDYYIWEGRLLLLVLACAFIAPLLMGQRCNR